MQSMDDYTDTPNFNPWLFDIQILKKKEEMYSAFFKWFSWLVRSYLVKDAVNPHNSGVNEFNTMTIETVIELSLLLFQYKEAVLDWKRSFGRTHLFLRII